MFRATAIAAITLIVTWFANGQGPVNWSAKKEAPSSAQKPGSGLRARVAAQIDQGWHIYSLTQPKGGPIATSIIVTTGQPFKLAGRIKGPRPRIEFNEGFGINVESYRGNVVFDVPIAVASDAPSGEQSLNINVRYQACNDTICLAPKTVKVTAPVEIVAGDPAERNSTPTPSPTPTPKERDANANVASNSEANIGPENASNNNSNSTPTVTTNEGPEAPPPYSADTVDPNSSLFAFLWAAAIAGALSLLTPCVFPMVPITVSYFTSHSEGGRGRATVNALIFALGIVLTFTVLGMLLALLFGAAGINKFAASPYVNIVIAALFIAFALSLFGVFNLGLPPKLLTRLDSFSRGRESSNILGLLLMGLVFSVTTLTCTAPLLGGLLVLATQGNWFYPALGMLAFSTVFALPFFVLALSPQLLAQLPRSGGWLNSVKVVMGFLEIAAAMKFISNVDLVWGWSIFTREVVLATWVAVALLIALYLLGVFQFSHDTKGNHVGAIRAMFSFVFLSLGVYMLTGLFGQSLGELESFLPPKVQSAVTTKATLASSDVSSSGELSWITNDYEKALNQAKKENKPVFVDFTGYTCTNCRWMEANMFPRPQVREQLEKYIRVRLYTDGEGLPYEQQQSMQQDRFGTVALPLYALVGSDGRTLTTFPGMTRDEKEFLSFLRTPVSTEIAKGR